MEGRLETTKLLINAYKDMGRSKDIDSHNNERANMLQYTALVRQENMNQEVAKLLLEVGVDPFQMNEDVSLMDIAPVSGNLAMVEYTLEKMYKLISTIKH